MIATASILALATVLAARPPLGTTMAEVDPAQVERLASAVQRALAEERLEGEVRESSWLSVPDAAPLDPAKDPPTHVLPAYVRLLGPTYAVVAAERCSTVTVYLDGDTYSTNPYGRSGVVTPRTETALFGGLALLLQADLFRPLELPAPLAATLRESKPISLEVEGTVATYRFVVAAEERQLAEIAATRGTPLAPAWPREVVVDWGEPPRVLAWATTIPAGQGPPRVDRWSVVSWSALDDRPLPRRVERSVTEGGEDLRYAAALELLDAASVPADPAPPPPIPAGFRIEDRAGFAFITGSPEFTYKGERFRAPAPLWKHPGDGLAELLQSAVRSEDGAGGPPKPR